MDKSKIFLDLSKCTEEERKHIFSLLPDDELRTYLRYNKFQPYLNFDFLQWFICNHEVISRKTELTYPEFIKLFEGGEVETELEAWKSVANELVQALKGLYYMIGCDVKCGYNGTNYLAATDVLEKYKNINSK